MKIILLLCISTLLFATQYDTLNFRSYMDALFEHNENAKDVFYQKKIDYLSNEIQKDKYGFDIFLSAYAKTGSYISTQQTKQKPIQKPQRFHESGTGVVLNINKLLYDGEYWLLQQNYNILNKRVADIKAINTKEKLSLVGVNIYLNLLNSQEKLEIFQNIYKLQQKIYQNIQKRYSLGVVSILDYIDAKNDMLNLERNILLLQYTHLHNEYILRHSIKSKGKNPYKLLPLKINISYDSLTQLQQEAIQNSSDIALISNTLKTSQTNLLKEKRRYYPTITFNSYVGYGAASDTLFFKDFDKLSFAPYGELSLNISIPFYNRGDIILKKERELHTILLQKNLLSQKTREILIEVERSYHLLQTLHNQEKILQQQLHLLEQKRKVVTKLFDAKTISYKKYADTLKTYLDYKIQMIDLHQQSIRENFILAILIGKKDLYE